jgi:hypothetical protein
MSAPAIATLVLAAAAPLATYEWSERTVPAGAELLAAGAETPFEAARVRNETGEPLTFTLLEIDSPPVEKTWHVTGQVRYADVEGKGYLELLNFFPSSAGPFFTRTLSPSGPLGALGGSSDWRRFALPFDASSGAERPTRLVVNVVLPGPGTVDVGPLELHSGFGDPATWASGDTWWGDRSAGLVFGSLGAAIGILGGVIGTLAGRGRAKGLVFFLWYVVIAVGAVSFLAGLAALGMRQPYAVYYPLLLTGVICLVVFGALHRTLRRRYEASELRRMRAMDSP